MTPDQFRAWKRRLGLSDRAAADALGLKLDTVRKYSLRASSPNRHVIPLIVAKLCEELARRILA